MNFDKDYNREEKINLAKKKLKKFRKYHNVSSGEVSRESLNNTDSSKSQSQTFSIPGTPNTNTTANTLSPIFYNKNNSVNTTSNNSNNNNNTNITNTVAATNSTTNTSGITNTTNDNAQNQIYNTSNATQFTTSVPDASTSTLNYSNLQYNYAMNSTTPTPPPVINTNASTNTNISNSGNGNAYTSPNTYYSSPNTYSFQTTTQSSYYPMDNTGNTYSLSSNIDTKVKEKKPTETRPSFRSGITGFVGSMFKNIIEAAAPPINPEYLQKYKSSNNNSLNSLDDNDNGMGNNYLVNNNSNKNDISTTNSNNNLSTNNLQQVEQVNEEPEYMKNIGNNSGTSTPLFIQNSNLINSQAPPPPTSAMAPSQYIRSMPKKKKKWAAFTYNDDEIVVDRENYSKNPANAISLKDYMDQQQQKQKETDVNKTSLESSKSSAFVPPKPIADTLSTNMFVPAPPKIEPEMSNNNSSMLSPYTPNTNNTSFSLSPNVNVTPTPPPPPMAGEGISATPTPPPPMAGAGISATPTPPPPMAGAGISVTPTPPPPMAGAGISATPTPPPPMAGAGISATPTPPPPMAGAGISATPTPPPPMAGAEISATLTPPPPMAGGRISATPTPPPPMAGGRISATPTPPPPRDSVSPIPPPPRDSVSPIPPPPRNSVSPIPPPPKAGTYSIGATSVQPQPKSTSYTGFSIPTPNNGFTIPTPSYYTNITTFVPANNNDALSDNNSQIYSTATVIHDEKDESSMDVSNITEDVSKIPSVVGIIEENDNILLSSPHIDGAVMNKRISKTSFTSLIKNPDVIELTSNSNVTTPIDESETQNESNLYNTGIESTDDNSSSIKEFSYDVGNENLSDILLSKHNKGKKKSKKNYSIPLADIMASPFGVHTKVTKEPNENKLSEVSSLDLEPVTADSNKNETYSETVSPDDTSSIFGVVRKNKDTVENSSLNQSFIPKDENIEQQSPSVVVKPKPTNDSLLFASNADGTNNNTNIMTDMQNADKNDLPFNLIDDLENVGISENNKMRKASFNKENSIVTPDKLNEMSDIPLDEITPEKSTRQFFTSKIFSETAKAKNLLSGMFPIKDNRSDSSSVGKLVNLAFNSHSENNDISDQSNPTTTKTNEENKNNNNNTILIPSNDVKVEQNVLFMTSPDNNDNNGLFLEQTDNKNVDNPLNITTSDTPKQEPLFATPTEQRKTGILYATNMNIANNLFGNDNEQYNVQQNNEFMSYISQDNNTEYQAQSYQDAGNTIQNSSVSFMDNQNKVSDIQDNNIPFFSSDNATTTNNVQDNNVPFFASDNTATATVQDSSIPFFSTDNSNTNNNGLHYGTTTDNSVYSQNNPALLYNTNNVDTAPMNDIYNQNSPTKFYISSGNATPLSTDVFNNNASFAMSNTISPIKNEDSNNIASLPQDSLEKTQSIPLFGQETNQQIQNNNDSFVKTDTLSFVDNNTVLIEATSKTEPLSFFASDNNTVDNNMVSVQDNSIPFFATTTQEANNIPLFSDSQTNMDNKNNFLSINTSNQISYNNNSSNNEKLPSASIFDNLTSQYTSNNVGFFDNQANGANWFEQFSQSSEPITPSSIISDNAEKQISPELQKSKLSNNIEISPLEKETPSTIDQTGFITESIVQNKTEETINNLTINEVVSTTANAEQIPTNPVIDQSQTNTLIEEIPANSVIEQVSMSPVTKQIPETEQAKLSSTEEPVNNNELLELKQELNIVNSKLQESTTVINELNQKIKQHEEQNASLIDKLKNIEENNKENVEKIIQHEKTIIQHEKTIEQLNSLIKTKDQQIELLKEENEIDLESKDNSTEFNKLNELLKEKIKVIEQLTIEKQRFETEISNQKKLLENKDIEFSNSQEKIKQLNEEINTITSNADSNKNEINELLNQIQELQSLLNGKESECNKLSKEKEKLELENKKQLDEANNSYSQLNNNYTVLQEELKKSKEQNIALEQEMNLIKSNNIDINNEDKEFIQKVRELYPNLSLQDIITKITNLNTEKEVVQPKPVDPSKTSNIQEINWNDMSNTDNKDESESFYIKDNLNAFTPQPFLPVSNEQIKKYEEENIELKQKCSTYQEAIEKDKAEIEYLKDIIKNQKITQLPQLALNDENSENHSLIEIISQLTKDNEALSLQIQELRQEVNSTNQTGTSLTYPKQPYETINTSNSYAYPSYLETTQPSSDLVYNQFYNGGNGSGSKSIEGKQGLNTYTSPYGNIIDNRVYEQPDYDLNYYDTSRLNSYTTPSSTYDHQQLLKQLDEREKNERNKMLASTSMSASQTDLLYKYNPYNY